MSDYKLVPVEPTEEMLRVMRTTYADTDSSWLDIYQAMLAATPPADLSDLRGLVHSWRNRDVGRICEGPVDLCADELEAALDRISE